MRSKHEYIEMTIHYNKESEKANRKKLRRNSTQAEQIWWKHLKGRKFLGLKFKRQFSIDRFILDFYCSEIKFAIELDGAVHLDDDVKNHDENRDGYLSAFGIKILRIENEMVINSIDNALELIKKSIMVIKPNLT